MTTNNIEQIKCILEGALLVAGEPLTIERMQQLFPEDEKITAKDIRKILADLAHEYTERAFELKEVASGFRIQVRSEYSPWVSKLWQERPPRASRAFLETLALIAYRQPITRGEIEDIRGVAVSTQIIKSLLEREWIRVVGTRDVPGKPSLYGTTKQFLDDLNLKNLDDLPVLTDLKDFNQIEMQLNPQAELPAVAANAEIIQEELIAEVAIIETETDESLETTQKEEQV